MYRGKKVIFESILLLGWSFVFFRFFRRCFGRKGKKYLWYLLSLDIFEYWMIRRAYGYFLVDNVYVFLF